MNENENVGGQYDKAPDELTEGWNDSGPLVEDDTVGFGDTAVPTNEYDASKTQRIQIPAGPGEFAEATIQNYEGHGPLRTIILKSHRKLASEKQRADIEEAENARITGINLLTAEARQDEITEDMQVPITPESRGFKGATPKSWFNERTYVKEGELYYVVDKAEGGLTRVHAPSAELGELFTRLAALNKNQEGNDFIKLTPEEMARL